MTDAMPKISRHGRVRIQSEGGLGWDVQVTDAESGEQILRVGEFEVRSVPGQPLTAYLKVYLPQLDVLANAEVETVVVQVQLLQNLLTRALARLAETDAGNAHTAFIEEAQEMARLMAGSVECERQARREAHADE